MISLLTSRPNSLIWWTGQSSLSNSKVWLKHSANRSAFPCLLSISLNVCRARIRWPIPSPSSPMIGIESILFRGFKAQGNDKIFSHHDDRLHMFKAFVRWFWVNQRHMTSYWKRVGWRVAIWVVRCEAHGEELLESGLSDHLNRASEFHSLFIRSWLQPCPWHSCRTNVIQIRHSKHSSSVVNHH